MISSSYRWYDAVNSLIAKHGLKRAMEVIKNEAGEVIELVVDKEDPDVRREKFGFFALFTPGYLCC